MATPAIRFVHHPGRYVRVDGTPIADQWSDLIDSSLDAPFTLTEFGGTAASVDLPCGLPAAWTGTGPAGVAFAGSKCNNWTTTMGVHAVAYGLIGAVDGQWSNGCFLNQANACLFQLPLYCFEQ